MIPVSSQSRRATRDAPITALEPARLYVPLTSECGPPVDPLVKPGALVTRGQLVGNSPPGSRIEVRIHAPRDGRVAGVRTVVLPGGEKARALELEVCSPAPAEPVPSVRVDREAILAAIRDAGIVGMGGAGFPLAAKLDIPDGVVNTVLVNACESEPYLTSDHRVLRELAPRVLDGLELLCRATGAERGLLALTADRRDAAEPFMRLPGAARFTVAVVDDVGALGYEKALIRAVLGRVVRAGGLPRDAGVSVHNVQTVVAVSDAVRLGRPPLDRVLTISGGAVRRPGNYRVPVGTLVRDLVSECGVDSSACAALVIGGPMMGVGITDLETPVRRATTALLALTEPEIRAARTTPCIRCGDCISVCPIGLEPVSVERAGAATPARLAELGVDLCVGCAECQVACPSGRPLLSVMLEARGRLRAHRSGGV